MKTNLWVLLAVSALLLTIPQEVFATGACTAARFNDWQNMGCNQCFGGAGGVPKAKCPICNGMPQWWVSEPYMSVCLSDTPLSYTTTSGQEMDFQFFYMQRAGLPGSDQVPTYYQTSRSDQYPTVPDCGTNAAWGNSWTASIQFWDAKWESVWALDCDSNGCVEFEPNYFPFTHTNYEALLFRPEGGINYFYSTNNGAAVSLRDPASQMRLVPSSGPYPLTTMVGPDSNGIYWGTNSAGFKIIYPDGSQDVFGLIAYDNYGFALSTARAFLSQRIDPQGRTMQLGYEQILVFPNYLYRLKYVVDPDGRTNQFIYTATNSFQVAAVEDPYGREATLGYDANGLLTNITDAAENTNYFQYSPNTWVTNPIYCYDSSNDVFVCGDQILNGSSSGWITSLTTPYGTTAFNYYQALDSTVTDGYQQRAVYVTEPTGAQQLYYYLHNNASMPSSETSPTNVPGQSFDDGTSGSTGHYSLTYRNTYHWGRRQFLALSSNVQSTITNDLAGALALLTTNDLNKADIKHWLLLGSDEVSITESLSSEQDPSPDTAGQIPGLRTWYNYSGKPSAELLGSDPQVSCIARILPDQTTQYTTYNYYTVTAVPGFPAGAGFVSDTESSCATPNGTVGVLTNQYYYAANSVDLVSITNSAGQWVNFGYNGNHQITYITNALNQVTSLSWDPYTFNLDGIQWPGGQSVDLEYGGPDYGRLTLISWSPSGRYINYGSYTNGLPLGIFNDRGLSMRASWDGLNRLTGILFFGGTSISYVYNRLDLAAAKDRLGIWTYYGYDGLRHLTSITNANNAVTTFSWCGCGSLESIIDALTNVTTLNYDNQGNLTNVLFPDYSSLTYQYDLAGRMTNVFDGAGRALHLAYNNQDLPTSITGANGTLAQVTYDGLNRPVTVIDANGVTVTNTYDLINELLTRTWPDGIGEGYGYNAAGLIAYTNRDQKVTRFGLDGAGRIVAITNANNEVIQLGYDSFDNITNLTDGLTNVTTWQDNEFGWITNKVDGLGRNALLLTYNNDGWITGRQTPEKGTTSYSYDNVGNLTTITYPSLTVKYSYDADNELTKMVDAVGTNTFTYTAAGELASETGPWSTDTVSYIYSQQLRTNLTLSEPGGSWTQSYGYDSAWRMANIMSPGGSFGYGYNFQPASALVSSIALPNGASITNIYDSLARLAQTSLYNHWGHVLDGQTYGLDQLSLQTNILRNLGLTSSSVSIGYDNIGQLTSWLAKETNGVPRLNEQLSFGFDSGDNLQFRTNGTLSQTFTVDSANELTNVMRAGKLTFSGATPAPATNITINGQTSQTYGDFTFAATNLSLSDGNNTFTSIAQNVYGVKITNTSTVNLAQNINLVYDKNGNLTNDGTRTFLYNTENQLTNVFVPNQWREDFIYDGFGRRRIARNYAWQSGAWYETNEVRIIYDGYMPIQERDTSNNVLVTYTRGIDLSGSLQWAGGIGGLLARTDANGSTYYHSDGAGNITALMDGQEDIVARYMYGPFGKLLGQWGTMAGINEMQFSSMPHDNLSGLSFYPFRPYEPNFQRWPTQDPIGESGGINLYRFNDNSPLNFTDPDGKGPWAWGFRGGLLTADIALLLQDSVNYQKYIEFSDKEREDEANRAEGDISKLQDIINSNGEKTFQQEGLGVTGLLGQNLPSNCPGQKLRDLFESGRNLEGSVSAANEAGTRLMNNATGQVVPDESQQSPDERVQLAQALINRDQNYVNWLMRNY